MGIARERIERLFELAEERTEEGENQLADRYVEIARNIGMRHNVSIPGELRRKFCSNCNSYLVPGKNCMVNIDSKKNLIVYRCEECGEEDSYGY